MYAWAQGKPFKVAAVPEDISEKREKLTARREQRKESVDKPRKIQSRHSNFQCENLRPTSDYLELGVSIAEWRQC